MSAVNGDNDRYDFVFFGCQRRKLFCNTYIYCGQPIQSGLFVSFLLLHACSGCLSAIAIGPQLVPIAENTGEPLPAWEDGGGQPTAGEGQQGLTAAGLPIAGSLIVSLAVYDQPGADVR
eukprot:scaffold246860_cov22-Prasinocladus_malaysianus.AAC.1